MLYGEVTLPGRPDLANVAKLDRLPLPMIGRMERYGIAIDIPYLNELSSQFAGHMRELERDISGYVPTDALHKFTARASDIEDDQGDSSINANSSEQIAKLLFDVLNIGSGTRLRTTSGGKRKSTGKDQLEKLRHEHPVVPKILKYREYAKLKSTYTDALPGLAKLHPRSDCCPVCELPHVDSTWRLHTDIATTRAETGRLCSRRPNLSNIPIRTNEGALVRATFIASPGTKFVSVDFSQIELRDMAHLADCKSMIRVYAQGGDIHAQTSLECFGSSDDEFRIPSKTSNFLVGYGGDHKTLYSKLLVAYSMKIGEGKMKGLPDWFCEDWCETFIERWFEARPEVKEFHYLQEYRARRYGFAWGPEGRIRPIPEIRSTHSWIVSAGIRQAGNFPIQDLAATQLKLAMAECEDIFVGLLGRGMWVWPELPVHDQLITEVEEESAEEVGDLCREVFRGVMLNPETGEDYSRVPIEADVEVMDRWKKE